MNQDPVNTRLREIAWRRPLTDAERAELHAWLETHPDARAEWEAELALSEQLQQMANAPVASNFTARVMAEVEKVSGSEQTSTVRVRFGWIQRFLPRIAVATVVVGLAWIGYHRYETAREAEQMAELMKALPEPEALRNFEVIQRLDPVVGPDMELLALNDELLALQP